MKRWFTVAVSVFLIALFVFTAGAIDIDGRNNGQEWIDGEYYPVFESSDQSGCSVEYADFLVQTDGKNTLYLLIQVIDSSFNEQKSAVKVTVNGRTRVLAVNEFAVYNDTFYKAYHAGNNNDYAIEAKITFAEPLKDDFPLTIVIVDGNGAESVKAANRVFGTLTAESETQNTMQQAGTSNTRTSKAPKMAPEKVTKPKTSKSKTSKSGSSKNKSSAGNGKRSGRADSRSGVIGGYTPDEENLSAELSETLTQTELNIDLSDGNVKNAERYKIFAGIIIFLILTAAAVIIIIPKVREKAPKEKNKNN